MRCVLYLVDKILGKTDGRKRSPKWREVRGEFLKENPSCAACGGTKKLEVHHVVPFHIDPSRELDTTNLMTLCRRKKYGIHCHLNLGHKGNYRDFNDDVVEMAAAMLEYLESRKSR